MVLLRDGKRKVLFNYSIPIRSRKDFIQLVSERTECKLAAIGLSSYDSLNSLFKKEDVKRLEKMVQIPCGCCRECLDNISRSWAFRIMQEASLYADNYFVTFTYNEENLPIDYLLDENFFQVYNQSVNFLHYK